MYVLETSQISGDPKPGICLTYVVSLVMLPIPWLRSGRSSLPAQFSGGHKIQNPVLRLYGATGFRGGYGPFCILFPSRACIGTALIELSGAIRDSLHGGVFASGHRLRSTRARGLKKRNCANVLLKATRTPLRRVSQGQTERSTILIIRQTRYQNCVLVACCHLAQI